MNGLNRICPPKYLIGIDVGTSGTKCVAFLEDGTAVAEAARSYPLHQPENGWAEQDPEDWWRAAKEALSEVTVALPAGEIAAIGLSGQMHGLVLLDESGHPLGRAILWCDGRTGEECREIEETVGRERLIAVTGNPAITGFTAESLLWVRKHDPERYARVRHVLLPKDYIRYRLTGVLATDPSDASGTQLFDTVDRKWSEEVCRLLSVDPAWLPAVTESAAVSGRVHARAARETGLPAGLPVAGGGADNACAALGSGVFRAGQAFVTVGTSGVLCAHTDRPLLHPAGGVHTFCSAVPSGWHAMGCTQASGLSLSWFRKNFAGDLSYAELDARGERVPIGAERLLYFPALMGELTPVFDPNARGAFVGLSAMHTVSELYRAVLEGVAYSFYADFRTFADLGAAVDRAVMCGGGAKSRLWRGIFSDLFGVPIGTVAASESAVLGAAILAGCAAGVYPSVEAGCERTVRAGEEILPNGAAHERYLAVYEVFAGLHPALGETFARLKSI